jgi:uroporphyrinogen-III synthase
LIVRLLLTRPEPDAERTANALRARGHAVVFAPLMRIEPIADAEIGSGAWAALLITSANAARAIAVHERFERLRGLPVFAVGEHCAAAMRAVGFADVTSANGDAVDLARLATELITPAAQLLYIAGADLSGDLAGTLAARGFAVHTAVVYRAVVAAAGLPRAVADVLAGGVDGVLHFSRRSAEAYVSAARGAGLHERALKKPAHFCLSAQVAEPLTQAGAEDIRIAPKPIEAALMELIPAA